MNEQQIVSMYKGQWKHIEIMYQFLVERARKARDPAGLAWAKAWRLQRLREVLRGAEEMRRCQ